MVRILLLIVLMGAGYGGTAQLIYYKEKLFSPYTMADAKAGKRRAIIISNAAAL